MKAVTKVNIVDPKKESLRSTIPIELSRALGLAEGDALEWEWNAKGTAAVVKKL